MTNNHIAPSFHDHRKTSFFTMWLAAIICITAILNNYEWILSGNTFTPERIMAAPLLLVTFFYFVAKQKKVKTSYPSLVLSVWVFLALASSITSKVSEWSMKMYAIQIMAISFYYLTIWLKPDPEAIFKSRIFLLTVFFMGPFLSLTYLASISGIPLPDFMTHWLQEGSGGTRIRATITEANLFGVFSSLLILIMLALKSKRNPWWWISLIGLHASLIFSFSRIPWAAYIASLVIYFSILSPYPYTLRKLVSFSITSSLFISGVTFTGIIIYYEFGSHEIIGRTHSLNTRLVMWGLAINSIIENPTIGNGIYSFSELYSFAPELVGSESHRSAWISNIFLAILHDTGILGLITFISFYYIIIKKGIKQVRRLALSGHSSNRNTRICAALTAFSISLLISGLSIPAHSLAFFWISIALLEVSCSNSHPNLIKRSSFQTEGENTK